IEEDEIKNLVKNPECKGVTIYSLEYFDLAGEGNDDAIVVASTCAPGTAGPDVNPGLRRPQGGSLLDLKIGEPTEKQQTALFGQVFYELNVNSGLLVPTYTEELGRTHQLHIQ